MAMLKPEIPPEQLQRIEPIVEPLLADLRSRALKLTPQSDPALVYEPDAEVSR